MLDLTASRANEASLIKKKPARVSLSSDTGGLGKEKGL